MSVFLQVIAWPAATTCPHHVRKPGRKWVREQSAHLSPFHQGRARCHREQDHGEEVGCQEKGGAAGSKHCGNKTQRVFFFLVDEINRSWWWCGLRTARLEVYFTFLYFRSSVTPLELVSFMSKILMMMTTRNSSQIQSWNKVNWILGALTRVGNKPIFRFENRFVTISRFFLSFLLFIEN